MSSKLVLKCRSHTRCCEVGGVKCEWVLCMKKKSMTTGGATDVRCVGGDPGGGG